MALIYLPLDVFVSLYGFKFEYLLAFLVIQRERPSQIHGWLSYCVVRIHMNPSRNKQVVCTTNP